MTDLAVYTVAALMVSALQLPLMKVAGTLALPWLAAVQGTALFTRRYEITSDALAVLALLVFLPLTLLGAQLIVLVFGVEYRAPVTLVGWLAFGVALRVLRGGPETGSLAVGDTKNLMLYNLVRSAGIFVAALALALEGGLAAVAAAMCLGEFAACAVAMVRLGHIVDAATAVGLRSLAAIVTAFLLALALEAGLPQDAFFLRAVLALTITAAGVAAMLRSSPELLKLVRTCFSGKGRLVS